MPPLSPPRSGGDVALAASGIRAAGNALSPPRSGGDVAERQRGGGGGAPIGPEGAKVALPAQVAVILRQTAGTCGGERRNFRRADGRAETDGVKPAEIIAYVRCGIRKKAGDVSRNVPGFLRFNAHLR